MYVYVGVGDCLLGGLTVICSVLRSAFMSMSISVFVVVFPHVISISALYVSFVRGFRYSIVGGSPLQGFITRGPLRKGFA